MSAAQASHRVTVRGSELRPGMEVFVRGMWTTVLGARREGGMVRLALETGTGRWGGIVGEDERFLMGGGAS